jgi:Ca-activated chloride channel family protein
MTQRKKSPGTIVALVLIALLGLLGACCACWGLFRIIESEVAPEAPPSAPTLTIAFSPEKEALFSQLVEQFNAQGFETPDGEGMVIETLRLEPEAMVDAALRQAQDVALKSEFQAMTPDSSIWLSQLDQAWMDQQGSQVPVVGETVRYAVSPVVIAMWEDVAQSMGYPQRSIGWEDILAKAQSDPNFKWSHPSTSSASGLLATLAEFYAGAGKTRGLTAEDAQAQATLDYVAAIEKTVRYYGEGEWAVVQQVLEKGRSYLDAFVCQEQLVVYFNQRSDDKLVAIYPKEGSLWEDHPLALLETPDLTADQRLVFSRFRDYLLSPEAQMLVLSHGYRPADLDISLDGPSSPITAANGVDPTEPQTALQIPSANVIEVVRNVWWYTKRHTNVYLVVDTSGSMEGQKLKNAQEALRIFVEQIKGDTEQVGLIEFYSYVSVVVPLDDLGRNRAQLITTIDTLEAGGDTALLDGIYMAYVRLQELNDTERINAIVAMTDGQENNSAISLQQLTEEMQRGNETGIPVVVFCIAFGSDADYDTLEIIAQSTNGQVREGDLETIQQLYKILSTYF